MSEDPRCCGTGTCIISADGMCWCGQRWDGEKMCFPKLETSPAVSTNARQVETAKADPLATVSSEFSAALKA